MDSVIELKGLTKDYGGGRGIFDIDLCVAKGEMLGFAGTNGSGKTTTIRNIMGFLKPTRGAAYVFGKEAWTHSSELVRRIGYVPGEIAFPDLATGIDFIKSQAEFLHVTDMTRAENVIERLQLDPRAPLKRMSKGMKQKTAIVVALMADPEIIILDEPTTGLDPLMRDAFLDLVREEHARGKTVFMSSHMFNELETTCNRVALIHDGRITEVADVNDVLYGGGKTYKIEFESAADHDKFKQSGYCIDRDQPQYNQLTVTLPREDLGKLFADLKPLDVRFISEVKHSLEQHFKNALKKEKGDM